MLTSPPIRWGILGTANIARVVGTKGEVRMSNPFHPREGDRMEVRRGSTVEIEDAHEGVPSFAPAIAHIHDVLLEQSVPCHLAIDDALGNARALDLLRASALAHSSSTSCCNSFS
jgi:predicted dehydrogenase